MKKRRIENKFPDLDHGVFGEKNYFDWYGKPMTLGQWVSMTEGQTQALGQTRLRYQGKEYRVSTVLLGIDYSFGHSKEPIIFETAVFGPDGPDVIQRYRTLQQARSGHRKCVRYFRQMFDDQRKLHRVLHNGRKP